VRIGTDIREIFIIGPSSTGKTTLCAALASELALKPECWITETARHVMRTRGFTRDDVGKLEMQSAIMYAQLESEARGRAYAQGASRILLSDRSAIDAVVYAVLTSANKEQAEARRRILVDSREFQNALEYYRCASVFLLGCVPEWLQDDGVRSLDDQETCLLAFRAILSDLGVRFVEIGAEVKGLPERVAMVRACTGLPTARL